MLSDYRKVLKAAADPTRARILKMLEGGEMCVCQVIAVLGLSQSTVSRHISLLKDAGLVRERRDAKFIYYSIEEDHRSEVAKTFLGNIRTWLVDDPVVANDRTLAARARRTVTSMTCMREQLFCRTLARKRHAAGGGGKRRRSARG